MKGILIPILCCFLCFSSCGGSNEADRDQIEDLIQQLIDADNRGDIETVVASYHPDAILLPPGGSEISGTQAIRKSYETIFQETILSIHAEIDHIKVIDHLAVCRGRTSGSARQKSDLAERTVNDKFLMILEKYQGRWLIKQLMWN